jgi:hypothetical protein
VRIAASITRRSLSAADTAIRRSTPGVKTSSIAFRHLPHAEQRVRQASQHQLLQAADPLVAPGPRRREDPLPQPSYSVLDGTPVHSVPFQDRVLGSVRPDPTRGRRPSVQLVPWFQRLVIRSLRRPTRSTSALFRGGPPGPVSGRLYDTTAGGAITCAVFPWPFGAPAFACWTILFPLRNSASLTVGLPALGWTATGFPRCTRMRPDRVGRLLDPGAKGVYPTERECPRRHPPLSSGQPYTPSQTAMRGGPSVTRHQRRFTLFARPIFLSPVASRDARGPSGFPLGSTPRRYQRRMPKVRTGLQTLAQDHVPGISRTSNQRDPLTTCALVSHPRPVACQ